MTEISKRIYGVNSQVNVGTSFPCIIIFHFFSLLLDSVKDIEIVEFSRRIKDLVKKKNENKKSKSEIFRQLIYVTYNMVSFRLFENKQNDTIPKQMRER